MNFRSTWNETLETPDCHKPINGLAGCELVLNEWEKELLDCCTPGNRTECFIYNQEDDYALEVLSAAPTNFQLCKKNELYSPVAKDCVGKFNG